MGEGTSLNFVGLADLNGDNKLDLLFVYFSGTSNTLLFLPGLAMELLIYRKT